VAGDYPWQLDKGLMPERKPMFYLFKYFVCAKGARWCKWKVSGRKSKTNFLTVPPYSLAHSWFLSISICIFCHVVLLEKLPGQLICSLYTGCPRRNGQNFGRVFLMLKYTDITQNTYIQGWTVTVIMAREVWNFQSCYTLIDYQIHIKTGKNMWFL